MKEIVSDEAKVIVGEVSAYFCPMVVDEQLVECNISQTMTDECRGEHLAWRVFASYVRIAKPISQPFDH